MRKFQQVLFAIAFLETVFYFFASLSCAERGSFTNFIFSTISFVVASTCVYLLRGVFNHE